MARPKSGGAVYQQITAVLRDRIRRGELRPGDLFPSEAAVSDEFGVARGTVRRALAELQQDGLIDVVPGVGRVVRARDGQSPAQRGRYQPIAQELRAAIEGGEYRSGQQLPSEVELARRYGVARSTVQRAVRELEETGLVRAIQGKGRFVV